MNADPRKILVIHFGQMGDVVLALPSMLAIRKRFADANITLLIGRSAAAAAEPANVADELMIVDRVKMRDGGKLSAIGDILRLARDIRRRRFDLAIDLHSLSETNILAFVAGIPSRLFADRENRSLNFLSNFSPKPPREDRGEHRARSYMKVLQPLGVETDPTPFRYNPDSVSAAKVDELLADLSLTGRRFAAIFPGAGHASRKWPIERFAELASRLVDEAIAPIIVLGPEEAPQRDEIAANFDERALIVDGLSIRELIALLSRAAVFVGNDSGPAHIAACSGVPVVLVIDERAPDTYLPLTDHLAVIATTTIDKIEVEDVYAALITAVGSGEK